jgi:hypothetical protein
VKFSVLAAAAGSLAGTVAAAVAGPVAGALVGFIFAFPLPLAGALIIGIAACFSWLFAIWAGVTFAAVLVAFGFGALRKPGRLANRIIGGTRYRAETAEPAPALQLPRPRPAVSGSGQHVHYHYHAADGQQAPAIGR